MKAELGQRPALQKLMLAGNQLRDLPDTLADLQQLGEAGAWEPVNERARVKAHQLDLTHEDVRHIVLLLQAGSAPQAAPAVDLVLLRPALAPTDYCASLRAPRGPTGAQAR